VAGKRVTDQVPWTEMSFMPSHVCREGGLDTKLHGALVGAIFGSVLHDAPGPVCPEYGNVSHRPAGALAA
jgi:hypothetical protein